MPKDYSRAERVVEQIRRELAELIRLELKDPRLNSPKSMVTLTDVEITPDYAHAKVFYTTLAEGEQRTEIERGLKHAAGFLRRELGRRVRIHHTPELHFVFDASVERGSQLSHLIDETVKADEERHRE